MGRGHRHRRSGLTPAGRVAPPGGRACRDPPPRWSSLSRPAPPLVELVETRTPAGRACRDHGILIPTTKYPPSRGLSSAGRALPLQGRCQEFESPRLHKPQMILRFLFFVASASRSSPVGASRFASWGCGSRSGSGAITFVPISRTSRPHQAHFASPSAELRVPIRRTSWGSGVRGGRCRARRHRVERSWCVRRGCGSRRSGAGPGWPGSRGRSRSAGSTSRLHRPR